MGRTKPRRQSVRRRRSTGPSMEVRELVIQRDKHRCARCGKHVNGLPGSIHHRTPRGMGGTRDPRVNSAANLLLLCGTGTTGCHGWVETHREEAKESGFLVPWWADPSEVPVRYWDGTGRQLDTAGGYALVGNQLGRP